MGSGAAAAVSARVRALVAVAAAARRASAAASAAAPVSAAAATTAAAAATGRGGAAAAAVPFRIGWAARQPQHQQQWQQPWQSHHAPLLLSRQLSTNNNNEKQQPQHPPPSPTGGSLASLPNALSLSRVAAAPVVSYLLTCGHHGPAVALLAAAGATDFLDGYLARRMGHTSVLGSYLDPLGDKVLAASVAVTLASLGAAPWWLAGLVAGRDAALVWGVYRARMRAFGGVWPGRRRFFDVDGVVGADGDCSSAAAPPEEEEERKQGGGGGGGGAMPPLRPLLVSKANTVVQLLFFGGCIGRLWLGEAVVPQGWLDAGETLTALTTAASAAAYLDELRRGRLPTVLGDRGGGGGGGDDDTQRS